jgi:hypothetical protein
MMYQDPCDVIHELIVVSRELLRLGDTGQEVPPTRVCAMLRTRRDLLQAEMRAQLSAASEPSGEEDAATGDRESKPTVRPPISSTRLKASVRPADSPSRARDQHKEGR